MKETGNRKLKFGMIGGGQGSFIGSVHRQALLMDGQAELVCGAFNTDPQKSRESGKSLYLPEERSYGSYQEMLEKERNLPEAQRMDFVVIVTPNHAHFEPAKLALENGFHVVCEKPVTVNTGEAETLQALAKKQNLLFAVTHPYTSYPLLKEARKMVAAGTLGNIRKVLVEYNQGWLATALEETGNKQASWRTNPEKAGKAGSLGDIGTHAFNLADFVTGLELDELSADITTFVPNRRLDDDANVLLRFKGGAKGIITFSQICTGEENNITLRVYGDKGSLQWRQEEPNSLTLRWLDKPQQIIRTADPNALSEEVMQHTRMPMGHPEGLIEAFANLYMNFMGALRMHEAGNPTNSFEYPTIADGVRTMQFIDHVLESGGANSRWTAFNA